MKEPAEEWVRVPHYAFEVLRQHATSTWLKRRFNSALRYQMRFDDLFTKGLKFTFYNDETPQRIEISHGVHKTTIHTNALEGLTPRTVKRYLYPMYREWWFDTYGGPG